MWLDTAVHRTLFSFGWLQNVLQAKIFSELLAFPGLSIPLYIISVITVMCYIILPVDSGAYREKSALCFGFEPMPV